MLRALVHHARRDEAAAIAQLGDVLATAAPTGFVRLFLDEGAPMTELAAHVDGTPATAALVARLRRTAYARPVVTAQEPQTHGLSERELDVLQLLATARTGPQIANELFVSVNTLRTHTKHIFTKLDVNTRRAAVARAGVLGLIRPL
jgi:LuxR family maltose regulon positive regulatory protein